MSTSDGVFQLMVERFTDEDQPSYELHPTVHYDIKSLDDTHRRNDVS